MAQMMFEVKLAKRDKNVSGPYQIALVINAPSEWQARQIAENQNRGYEYWSSRTIFNR